MEKKCSLPYRSNSTDLLRVSGAGANQFDGPSDLACVSIPSPAKMVIIASSIAIGNISIGEGGPFFEPKRTLKGVEIDKGSHLLVEPNGSKGFDQSGKNGLNEADQVIFLGDFDAGSGDLLLRWLHASIWPSKPEFATFPSGQFDTCLAFVLTVLNYEKLASKDLVELSDLLVHDIDGANVYAALDWTDVSLRSHTDEKKPELGELVPWAMYGRILLKPNDRFVDHQVVSMFPLLPPTLAIPHLLRIAETENAPAAARSRVEALLRAYGFTRDKKLPVKDLMKVFKVNRLSLQMDDELKAKENVL
jgi:hypothetical protein